MLIKVGGPPYALSVELIRGLLVPLGFEAVEVREDLPPSEHHLPGGIAAIGGPGTALAAWCVQA